MGARKIAFINANGLKFIAAFFMLIDHFGFIFYPEVAIFRILGRISMPLFAFAISEGCRYTRNKTKHFFLLFALALLCQIVYYFFDDGSLYLSILITFSLSVLTIYALQFFKKCVFEKAAWWKTAIALLLFCGSVAFAYFISSPYMQRRGVALDYGFWGVMLPVFASLFDFRRIHTPAFLQKCDRIWVRLIPFTIGLLLLAFSLHPFVSDGLPTFLPFYAFLAMPILLLYNGEKGKWKTKYFFYIFYPVHLALLEGLYMYLYLL